MAAYLVVDTQISDPESYEDYKRQAKPLAEKHGGVYRARGGALEVLEDDLGAPTRLVIIEFPNMDAARAFAADPDYTPVKAIRRAAAKATIAIIDGV